MSAESKKRWRQNRANRESENESRRKHSAPPQGPIGALVPVGHEIGGVSTLAGPGGEIEQQWTKTRVAGNPDPEPPPPDFALARVSTMSRGDGSEVVRWQSFDRAKADAHAALMKAWGDHATAARIEGVARPAPLPDRTSETTLTIYPIGDHHLGMLAWWRETGESWDLEKGVESLQLAGSELVRRAEPSGRALIVNLGDFKHAPDNRQITPGHGNKLDVDGRSAKIDRAGVALMVGVIDAALTKHRHVTVHNLPGNHDPEFAAAFALMLECWYRNEPRVHIADANPAHQYYRFGQNLIGMHHGDGTPSSELPAIMAVDMAEDWGQTLFHMWLCGHVHHKIKDKEHPGCTVECFRILPPGDAWHARRYRAGRGMTAITIDQDFGEVGRATIGIEQVQALLKRRDGT